MADSVKIPLTRGLTTTVDAADAPMILGVGRWHAHARPGQIVARRTFQADGVKRSVLLHRFLMDAPAGVQVDHINGDPLDNRRANLRLCTGPENQRNRRANRGGTSRFKCVAATARGKPWRAVIQVNGVSTILGCFHDEIAAARAYDAAARRLHGSFARLNFPATEAKEAPRCISENENRHALSPPGC